MNSMNARETRSSLTLSMIHNCIVVRMVLCASFVPWTSPPLRQPEQILGGTNFHIHDFLQLDFVQCNFLLDCKFISVLVCGEFDVTNL